MDTDDFEFNVSDFDFMDVQSSADRFAAISANFAMRLAEAQLQDHLELNRALYEQRRIQSQINASNEYYFQLDQDENTTYRTEFINTLDNEIENVQANVWRNLNGQSSNKGDAIDVDFF